MIEAGFIALGVIYAGIILAFTVGIRRVIRRSHTPSFESGDLPFVSVIVPARDEEASIAACVTSILGNEYPHDRFEVIVVDDLSKDRTAEIVRKLADSAYAGRLHLVQMPENLERTRAHKKRAISKGIDCAKGSVILTTDADCTVAPKWIRTMIDTFDVKTAFVAGPVVYRLESSVIKKAEALEFMSMVAVSAGAIGINRPNMCNGANVAYRKSVFEDLGGFSGIDHLTSGDDELLMQKIAYTSPWNVRFCAYCDALVETNGVLDFRAFYEQRRRWASKGAHYPHLPLRLTVLAIYVFYVALFLGIPLWSLGVISESALLTGLLLKIIPESFLLGIASRQFGRADLMWLYLPLVPFQTLYVVVMGIAGTGGNYVWKGRRIAR